MRQGCNAVRAPAHPCGIEPNGTNGSHVSVTAFAFCLSNRDFGQEFYPVLVIRFFTWLVNVKVHRLALLGNFDVHHRGTTNCWGTSNFQTRSFDFSCHDQFGMTVTSIG